MNEELFNKIMCRINEERARIRAIRNFVIASTVCAVALVSFVYIWNAFISELAVSGFTRFASLAFLDLRAVLINWQDYGMSLLESFPVVNAAALLGIVVALMLSIKFIFIYGKRSAIYAK